mmetsp:Transcript_27993/g.68452  ORF Transcript_27993/g.68452 Transcript_27993/m.68452 type:complete len:240 (-) Transcript_27993:3931-4650(-)
MCEPKVGCDLLNAAVSPRRGRVLIPVVSDAHLPVEVMLGVCLVIDQVLQNVSVVNVNRDESHKSPALKGRKLASDEHDHVAEVLNVLLIPLLHTLQGVAAHELTVEGLLRPLAPVDLGCGDEDLPPVVLDPVLARPLCVVNHRLLGEEAQRFDHALLHCHQPVLDFATRLQVLAHCNVLILGRYDAINVNRRLVKSADGRLSVLPAEVEPLDGVEALHHVRLHSLHVSCLRKDLEKLVV